MPDRPRACETAHQSPVDASPRREGLRVLSSTARWTTVGVRAMAVSRDLCPFMLLGASSWVPSVVYGATGPVG